MSYGHAETIAAQQHRALVEAGYITAGSEVAPVLHPAEAEPQLLKTPEAAAKIAVAATFNENGILLESGDRTRQIGFLPRIPAENRNGFQQDLVAVRRDLTWEVLNNPGTVFESRDLHYLMPACTHAHSQRLLTRMHQWWSGSLRIGSRALIVPTKISNIRFGHVTNSRLDILALREDRKAQDV